MGINLCAEGNRQNIKSFSSPSPENYNRVCHQGYDSDDSDIKETWGGLKPAREAHKKQWQSSPVLHLGVKGSRLSSEKHPRCNRAKSLAEKLQERREHPESYDEFRDSDEVTGEREAKMYMDEVENNSIQQLSQTFSTVESMLVKETDIQRELRRQDEVVKNANRDICAAGKDIDDTSFMLKGMRSLGGKVVNLVSKSPRHLMKSISLLETDHEPENNIRRSRTEPICFPSGAPDKSKQELISEGVDQLSSLLDVVETKQLEIGDELEKQHETMQILDQNMDDIESKIGHQTDLMKSIKK